MPTMDPQPGQVRNINQHSLAGLIEEAGGELKDWGVIRDDRAQLTEAIGAALDWADAVLLSGGSSMGAKDIALETILSFPDSAIYFPWYLHRARQADDFRQSLRQADPRFAGLSGIRSGDLRFVRRADAAPLGRREPSTRCSVSAAPCGRS